MGTPFQAGGPLSPDSPIYIERKADHEVVQYVQQLQYVQLTEPRQQGKTSLIYRLHDTLRSTVYKLAFVDAESLKSKNEAVWFQDLATRLKGQFRRDVKCDDLSLPADASSWRTFLANLVAAEPFAANVRPRLIIALDEVGSVPVSWAEGFFRVLREVYNVRGFETDFRWLSFVLIGAFDPRDLIQDANISPFNIAQRVNIVDLDLTQVQTLVDQLNLPPEQAETVAKRVYYWTDGQPYLTQKLCLYLAEDDGSKITPDIVDASVDRLFQDDINHLPRIFKDLETEPDLLDYTRQIVGGSVKFTPAVNPQHFRLSHVIGVIKPDESGLCRIRNRIYEQALKDNIVVHYASASDIETNPSPQIASPLDEALESRNLALFIGADLPVTVTGLPSRTDLARDLTQRKGLDESLPLAEIAQRVSQAGNRWEFTNFIRNALDTTGKSSRPFHQRIVVLVKEHRIETIITTAYDNLLELAFQQAGIGLNRVVRGSDVNFIEPERPTLIKLYGDAQQPDTLVITDRDHSDLLRDRDKEAVIDEVRRAFRRNTLLIFGYNLADPDFRFLFDQIAESRFVRLAYAVWSGLPETDIRMWRDRGIVILETAPKGLLDHTPMPIQSVRQPEVTIEPTSNEPSQLRQDRDVSNDLKISTEVIDKSWKDESVMNPELFIEQQNVPGFLGALRSFANTFPVADDRRNILTGCGIEANFFGNLKLDANPVAFANNLLAEFREYRVSTARLDYHPLVIFLDFVLSTGSENYGFNEQQTALSEVILNRGKENLKALTARNSVGRVESPQGTGIGTGVLVGRDLVLTCRHVFSGVQQAWVRFGYKEGSLNLEDVFELDPNFVSTHNQNQLDYALVRIKGQPKPKPFKPVSRVLSAGDEIQLRVIHHPEGQPVVISGVGQIVQVGEDYIDHTLKTAKGSSGAPILDQNWELIAIHRGDTRMGRTPSPNTTEGLPIKAIWERIAPHLT